VRGERGRRYSIACSLSEEAMRGRNLMEGGWGHGEV